MREGLKTTVRRALTRRGITGEILTWLRRLGVLVIYGVTFTNVPAHAAADIVVPRDFPTIQAAVDATAPGDTIKVRPGTYTEEIVIAKDLTLKGAGIGATIIKAPSTLTSFALHLPTGRSLAAVVLITDGAHVDMSGFTVTGPIPCAMEVTGIQATKAATLNLSKSRVTGIHPDHASCPPQDSSGRAVVLGLPPHIVMDGENGSTSHGTISDVTIDSYGHAGITVTGPADGSPSTATISGNVITGGLEIPTFQYGIHIAAGAVVQVTKNTVSGNVCTLPFCGPDPITQQPGIGILVVPEIAVPEVEISKNRIADNEAGIYQFGSPNCCTISENKLKDNRFFGIVIQDGDGKTSENSIKGGEVGIGVVADFVDTLGLLQGDKIKQTSAAPVQEIECCGFSATAIVE